RVVQPPSSTLFPYTTLFRSVLILSSFVVGALARWAVPGPDPMGFLGTVALGLTGSLLGGLLSFFLWGRTGGIIFAVIGAVVVLRSEEHTSELQSLAYLVCRL